VDLSRRHFLRNSGAVALGFIGLRNFIDHGALAQTAAPAVSPLASSGYGPLIPDPNRIFDLPRGFSCRVISRAGETMDDGFLVPGAADGMAAFPGPNGRTILVRNHELDPASGGGPFGVKNALLPRIDRAKLYDAGKGMTPGPGGTTTLVYDGKRGVLEKHFLSLAGTHRNCAGGPTPWNSWVSCEETLVRAHETIEQDHGYNFEVPVSATPSLANPIPLKAMGRFNHEAIAVDPKTGIVYQTEDRGDGLLYRFIPNRYGKLAEGGRLQALVVKGARSLDTRNWDLPAAVQVGQSLDVEWLDMDNVEAPDDDLRLRGFNAGAARFSRGEGMWFGRGEVYFACTDGGNNRKGQIWRYRPSINEGRPGEAAAPGRLELFAEPNDGNLVENADNLTIAPWGDLIVCEDGAAEQYLVGVTPQGKFYRLGRNAFNNAELAGVTFGPTTAAGTTLFVNIYNPGMTVAITGPWQRRA